MHETYGYNLFAKNVRMFLFRRAERQESAARQIKHSLEQICAGKMATRDFGMIHNGVTLAVPRVSGLSAEKLVLEPGSRGIFVLNGCQTVYTAWKFFKAEVAKKGGVGNWREKWAEIQLPMRVVVSSDDELLQTVTIGANRQTAILSSALWAHDAVQQSLATRFARYRIFYERQEGAWDQFSRSEPAKAQEYLGTINIEDLARTMAAADRALPLEYAKSPSKIFESKEAYAKVFKEKNLVSVRLLVSLWNLFRGTQVCLKDLSNEVGKLNGLKPSGFVFPVFRVLAHWLMKNDRESFGDFADAVFYPSPMSEIRKRVKQWLNHNHSRIQQLLPKIWWDDEKDWWSKPQDKERVASAFQKLKLNGTFLFEGWSEFDNEL